MDMTFIPPAELYNTPPCQISIMFDSMWWTATCDCGWQDGGWLTEERATRRAGRHLEGLT